MREIWKRMWNNPIAKKGVVFALVFALCSTILSGVYLGFARNGAEPEFVYLDSVPLSYELQKYTFDLCRELDIEYELVLAVMWRESRFQVDAVGYNSNGTQDNGVMQINDVNREWLSQDHGIVDLMDPYQNIRAGTAMLAQYIHKYGDERTAIMAYQLGEGGMLQKQADGVYTNGHTEDLLSVRNDFRNRMIQATAESAEQESRSQSEKQATRDSDETEAVAVVRHDEENDDSTGAVAAIARVVTGTEEESQQERTAVAREEDSPGSRERGGRTGDERRAVSAEEMLEAYEAALPQAENGVVTVELWGWYSEIGPEIQSSLQERARQDGVQARLRINQIQGRTVVARYTLEPGNAVDALQLAADTDSGESRKLTALFTAYFTNPLTVVAASETGDDGAQWIELAVRPVMDGMDTDNLVLYAYDRESNTYNRLGDSRYRVDGNGFLHLATRWTGDLVVSEGELTPLEDDGQTAE